MRRVERLPLRALRRRRPPVRRGADRLRRRRVHGVEAPAVHPLEHDEVAARVGDRDRDRDLRLPRRWRSRSPSSCARRRASGAWCPRRTSRRSSSKHQAGNRAGGDQPQRMQPRERGHRGHDRRRARSHAVPAPAPCASTTPLAITSPTVSGARPCCTIVFHGASPPRVSTCANAYTASDDGRMNASGATIARGARRSGSRAAS